MSKIKRERKKKEKKSIPLLEEDLVDTCKAASANDCTGLIQVGQLDKDEIEAYKDLYDFGPSEDDYI